MKSRSLVEWLVIAISVLTIISGLTQMVAPGFVLSLIKGQETPTSLHFFGIIGMFMALFGGMLLQAVRSPAPQRVAIFWAALQKFGASAAVAFGVEHRIFSALALAIASFDGLSGCLIFWYWSRGVDKT